MSDAPVPHDLPPGELFYGGEWHQPLSGETMPDINPATEAEFYRVAKGGAEDVDRVVESAREALTGPWSQMTAGERGKLVYKLAEAIDSNADELARLESLDCGKPVREARYVDVPLVADIFRYYAGWATKVHGETLPARPDAFCFTLREPVGVVAGIVPWNFPLLLSSWKIAPALALGNTFILKPASNTPLTALKLAALSAEVGLPPGVFNVVTGGGSTLGAALVHHPGIDKIAFTGSTEVGKWIQREAASTLKRVTLELGGKSPNIVLRDADLDAAARGAVNAIFYNKGEVCAAGSRLLVHEAVHDELMERVVARAEKMALGQGNPLDPKTRLGPQISEDHMQSVLRFISRGIEEGATLAAGGERNTAPGKGYFIKPTVFTDVQPDHTIAREEIFGPVVATLRFSDEEEAIRLGNQSMYGLAAGIWTRDISKALKLAKAIKAGTVWVNTYNMYDPAMPFGGYKASGFGRELGARALESYTESKSVWVALD
jgi:aldehyde dehydrogenase (NAD+)